MSKESQTPDRDYLLNLCETIGEKMENFKLEDEDVTFFDKIYFSFMNGQKDQFTPSEIIGIGQVLLEAYRQTHFYWRGKKAATFLYNQVVLKKMDLDEDDKYQLFYQLGQYYRLVSDQKMALLCFTKAASIDDDYWELIYNIVVCQKLLELDELYIDKDEAIRKYGQKDGERIALAIEGKRYIKFDPIENSDEFQRVYDEVHEEMLKKLGPIKEVNNLRRVFATLTELYMARGIFWNSPIVMNPHIRFD